MRNTPTFGIPGRTDFCIDIENTQQAIDLNSLALFALVNSHRSHALP
jgi:NADH dehydrogenase FAD-containing subunit